jgi:hypothetical protein
MNTFEDSPIPLRISGSEFLKVGAFLTGIISLVGSLSGFVPILLGSVFTTGMCVYLLSSISV